MTAHAARLPDGRRVHLHGPIDLILEAWGPPAAVANDYAAATRLAPLLDEFVAELPAVRSPGPARSPARPRRTPRACLTLGGHADAIRGLDDVLATDDAFPAETRLR